MMELSGSFWVVISIVSAIVLAVVIAWAALRNRADAPKAEHGETKRVYRQEDRAEGGEADDVP